MLIPSIDLMNGRIVQLEQGERLVLDTGDVDGWMARFSGYPIVQLIDLDAAKDTGRNHELVRRICATLPCQVGGGIRSPALAIEALAAGARRVLVGSALFGPDGADVPRAEEFAAAVGPARLVAAVDTRGGQVVVRGWTRAVPISPVDAMRALSPFAETFLYTHVETEGLLGGFDLTLAATLRDATTRRLIVAGGIRSHEEISALDRIGIDAVVGMAIYRGLIDVTLAPPGASPGPTAQE